MYRTNDDYNLSFDGEVLDLESKYRMIEEHDLSYYYKFDSVKNLILFQNMEVFSTYKEYKKFIFLLYKIIGPLDLEISFYPEEYAEGYTESTEVEFVVDSDGNASFDLTNEVEPDEDLDEDSEEYKNFQIAQGRRMFEGDKSLKFSITDMTLESFLETID